MTSKPVPADYDDLLSGVLAAAWPDPEILQQLLQNLGWSQNVILLDRLQSLA